MRASLSDPDTPPQRWEIRIDPKKLIIGILTDRDLCIRILASGLPYDTPVAEVMTT